MLTSPFADASPAAEQSPAIEEPRAAEQPPPPAPAVNPPRIRRGLLEVLHVWMPGVGAAQLPSIATVRAYHRAHDYVRSEAEWRIWMAVIFGWFAVCWITVFTVIAWAGAGDYKRRIRTLWRIGVPGLVRTQLPPLEHLAGARLVWVACWSAVAWAGLKFTRPAMTLAYLLLAILPVLF